MSNTEHLHVVEDIFKEIGDFGPYQLFLISAISLVAIIPCLVSYGYSFYGAVPEFRCKLPMLSNDTYEVWGKYHQELVDQYIPLSSAKSYKGKYDGCNIRVFNPASQANLTKCTEWVYSKQYFGTTLSTEWNLVCENSPKRSLIATLFFAGAFGMFLNGILADKYGRKKMIYFLVVINAVLEILTAVLLNVRFLSNEFKQIAFMSLRFLSGYTANNYSLAVVLCVEMCGPSRRVTAVTFANYFFIMSEFIVVLLAFFLRSYNLFVIANAVALSVLILYFWIVPESPRWLVVSKKDYPSALTTFERIAKSNKKSNDCLKKFEIFNKEGKHDQDAKASRVAEEKNQVYFGISFNTSELAGDPYMNFALSAVVELFATFISDIVLNRFNRKIPYCFNMFLSGLALCLVGLVPSTSPYLITILALVGKFAISFTYNEIYVITAELYPTVIRNGAMSTCQTFSRFGAILSPQVQLLGSLIWYPLPFLIYGTVSTLAAISFMLFMPETKNKKLPDTIDDFLNEI